MNENRTVNRNLTKECDCMIKKLIALVLALICVLGFAGCEKKVEHNDFYDYYEDFMAVIHFVLGYDYNNIVSDQISSFTIDINEGYIKIDDSYQSTDVLMHSIEKIRKKGFTYIEVSENYMIFWEDNGFYGWLWTYESVEALECITKSECPYMKLQKITDEWYEVRVI